ncbi:MAG: HAD family hydrolase [Caulobacterales bacterium]
MVFPRPIRAVVFDMDGLLIDTESPIRDALMAAAQAMDRELPLRVFLRMIGTTDADSNRMLADHFGPGFDLEAYHHDVRRRVDVAFEAGVQLKAGVFELLDVLDDLGLPRAVATSSSRASVERCLAPPLFGRFSAFVTRESVVNGKPHPEPYLKAAAALATPPGDCLALEDSHNGVRAAHAAGMMTVMVPDLLDPTDEMHDKCVAIAQSLHHVRDLIVARQPRALS